MSTRTGALPYSVGAQGLKARDRPLLFGGHLLHMPEAADWWDACSEGLAMGALALERIVHTLFNNFAEFSHIAGVVSLYLWPVCCCDIFIIHLARVNLQCLPPPKPNPNRSLIEDHCHVFDLYVSWAHASIF